MQIRELIADLIYPEGRERRDQAERIADTDALTGLANRRALDRALPTAEVDPDTSVVFFDANNFGLVNKQQGDAAGDELLREMAAAIQLTGKRFGCATRVFRKGGDEFVALVPTRWAHSFRDAAEAEFGIRGTVSLSGNVGSTLAQADERLQERKRQRKSDLNFARSAIVPGDCRVCL